MNGSETTPSAKTTSVSPNTPQSVSAGARSRPAASLTSKKGAKHHKRGEADGSDNKSSDPAAEEKNIKLHELDFVVSKSIRYHAQRRSFYDVLDRFSKFTSALTGASAFAVATKQLTDQYAWIALIPACYSLADLVLGFADKARVHNDLYRRFSRLAERIVAVERPITTAELANLNIIRLRIEADEPTSMAVLNVICQNEEAEARGYDNEYTYRIGWLARIFRHFFSLQENFISVAEYEKNKAQKKQREAPKQLEAPRESALKVAVQIPNEPMVEVGSQRGATVESKGAPQQ